MGGKKLNLNEIVAAAQNLSYEQRKELIKALLAQLPKTEPLAGSVVSAGNLEAGSQEIREQVNAAIQGSALELCADEAEP